MTLYKSIKDNFIEWKNLIAKNKKGTLLGAVALPPLWNIADNILHIALEYYGIPTPRTLYDFNLNSHIVYRQLLELQYNLIPDLPLGATLGALLFERKRKAETK